jgi:hypothetical protein
MEWAGGAVAGDDTSSVGGDCVVAEPMWRGLRCGGAYVAGRHTLSQQEWFTLGAQLQHFSVYMIPL